MSPPLPPPLPPDTRTVGQLVAETLRLYGRRFWPSLALGLPVAVIDQAFFGLSRGEWLAAMLTGGAVLLTAAYVGASAIAADERPPAPALVTAFAAGLVAFLPFPVLMLFYALPGIAWLALVGLAVPAALIERSGFRASLRRGVRLARADYVHALGALATLALTYFLTRLMLILLLRGTGDQTARIATFLADLVLSPILFLGAALLYFDQAARVVVSPSRRKRRSRRSDAHVSHAHDADGAGRADAPVEPGPAARGEP